MLVTMFAMLSGIANATEMNPLWMVSSRAAMISYVKSLVHEGYGGFSSAGSVAQMTTTNYTQMVVLPDGKNDMFAVVDLLSEQTISFAVARPETDYVCFYEYLCDKTGKTLIQGWSYGNFEKDENGNWQVPASIFTNVDLRLSYQFPIYIDGAVEAKVILRDENGNVVSTEYFSTSYGQGGSSSFFYFNSDYSGFNGELVVTTYDGKRYKTIVSSLRDNVKYNIITQTANIDATSSEIVRLPDNSVDYGARLQSNGGQGVSPLICGKYIAKMWLTLTVETTEGEMPRGVWYKNTDISGSDWQYAAIKSYCPYPNGNGPTLYYIEVYIDGAGNFDFILDWEKFDNKTYSWWYYGGKG
jgi:hypothetical protein